jgi:hypothetical protein
VTLFTRGVAVAPGGNVAAAKLGVGMRVFCLLVVLAGVWLAGPARAAAVCVGTDDTLRPLPAALVPAAERLFGLHGMKAAEVVRNTVVRCVAGRVWACNYGANLPCGRADLAARLPAADAWCRANPGAGFIPAYVVGHDSVYSWRCVAGVPQAGTKAAEDGRGFFKAYWREVG